MALSIWLIIAKSAVHHAPKFCRRVGMEMSFNLAATTATSASNIVTQNLNEHISQLENAASSLSEASSQLTENEASSSEPAITTVQGMLSAVPVFCIPSNKISLIECTTQWCCLYSLIAISSLMSGEQTTCELLIADHTTLNWGNTLGGFWRCWDSDAMFAIWGEALPSLSGPVIICDQGY